MAITGRGRHPIHSSWVKSFSVLYNTAIPGHSEDLDVALNDFWFGRDTTIDLFMWNGTAWEEPTMFQKLLNANPTHWAPPTPVNLSQAVNRLASAVYTLSGSTPIP